MAIRANGLRKAEKPRLGGSKVSEDSQNSISHYNTSAKSRPKLNVSNSSQQNSNKYISGPVNSVTPQTNGGIQANSNGVVISNNTYGYQSHPNNFPQDSAGERGKIFPSPNNSLASNKNNKLNDYQQLQHNHYKIFKNGHGGENGGQNSNSSYQNNSSQNNNNMRELKTLQEEYMSVVAKYTKL